MDFFLTSHVDYWLSCFCSMAAFNAARKIVDAGSVLRMAEEAQKFRAADISVSMVLSKFSPFRQLSHDWSCAKIYSFMYCHTCTDGFILKWILYRLSVVKPNVLEILDTMPRSPLSLMRVLMLSLLYSNRKIRKYTESYWSCTQIYSFMCCHTFTDGFVLKWILNRLSEYCERPVHNVLCPLTMIVLPIRFCYCTWRLSALPPSKECIFLGGWRNNIIQTHHVFFSTWGHLEPHLERTWPVSL